MTPAVVLDQALTRPAGLSPASLDAVLATLDPLDASAWEPALAALVYARPDLITPVVVHRLAIVLSSPVVADSAAYAAAMVLEALIPTEVAAHVLEVLNRLLGDERLTAPVRDRLVALLHALVSWRPELSSVAAVVELAAAATLAPHRDAFLGQVVEPLLVREPEHVTPDLVDRMMAVFADCRRLPYTLAILGERHATTAALRTHVAPIVDGAFPLRAAARSVLSREPFDLLVVVNVRFGQGDELIRVVPPLQAFLDAHVGLRVALVTKRVYLYDHPRVRPMAILDDAAVEQALALPYAGVLHLCEPRWHEVPWRPDLDGRVDELVRAQRPALVITADPGRSHLVYRAVTLDGREVAGECPLDRGMIDNVYDPCRRLLIELGLWAPAAEEPSAGARVLTATPSADAERVWAELTRGLTRPVALVNPFGGTDPTKGYPPDRPEALAIEVTALVSEGYAVVLIPNGTPWGRQTAAMEVLRRLAPGIRDRVRIAPDPAETDAAARVPLSERPELPYDDRVMRLFKYFVIRADLIVAVEGWLVHLAYVLGRPFRLVLQNQSHGFDWHPALRGPNQRLSPALSPHGRRAAADLLGFDGPPPLPARDRAPVLRAAVAGLHALGPGPALPLLVQALTSEDRGLRASAVTSLGALRDERAKPHLLAALRDPAPRVRHAAAVTLLKTGADYARELGPHFHAQLAAHRDIARQAWPDVRRLGTLAVPALFVAADGADATIRRGARSVLRHLMEQHRLGPFSR